MGTVFSVLVNVVVGVLFLSIIMILHELGHYVAARLLKFKILEFSLFMGPVLYEKKVNGVRYNIKMFPIGASVSFANEYGEADTPEEMLSKHKPGDDRANEPEFDPNDPGCFNNRPRWARAIVVFMGPFVNFVTAFLCFILLFAIQGAEILTVANVAPNSKAAVAGINPGDKIVAVSSQSVATPIDYRLANRIAPSENNRTITISNASDQEQTYNFAARVRKKVLGVQLANKNGEYVVAKIDEAVKSTTLLAEGDVIVNVGGIKMEEGKRVSESIQDKSEVPVEVKRKGEAKTLQIRPVEIEAELPDGLIFVISHKICDILNQSVLAPWSVIKGTVRALGSIVTGKMSAKENLSGPVGIISIVGNVATQQSVPLLQRMLNLLTLLAVISVAVGFTNLLPIPPFDGFQLTVFGIEGTIRRNVPERIKTVLAVIGVIFIVGLALVVTVFDVLKLLF